MSAAAAQGAAAEHAAHAAQIVRAERIAALLARELRAARDAEMRGAVRLALLLGREAAILKPRR